MNKASLCFCLTSDLNCKQTKYENCDPYLVLALDELDNVGRVVGEGADGAALDVGSQEVVHVELLLGDGEDQVDRVLLDFVVDLGHGGVVQLVGVRVGALGIEMAESVVWLDNSAKFAIP